MCFLFCAHYLHSIIINRKLEIIFFFFIEYQERHIKNNLLPFILLIKYSTWKLSSPDFMSESFSEEILPHKASSFPYIAILKKEGPCLWEINTLGVGFTVARQKVKKASIIKNRRAHLTLESREYLTLGLKNWLGQIDFKSRRCLFKIERNCCKIVKKRKESCKTHDL